MTVKQLLGKHGSPMALGATIGPLQGESDLVRFLMFESWSVATFWFPDGQTKKQIKANQTRKSPTGSQDSPHFNRATQKHSTSIPKGTIVGFGKGLPFVCGTHWSRFRCPKRLNSKTNQNHSEPIIGNLSGGCPLRYHSDHSEHAVC